MYHLRRHMHLQSSTLLLWSFTTTTTTTTQMPRQRLAVRRHLQAMSLHPAKLRGIITNNNSRRFTTIPPIHLLAPLPIQKLKL
jgi:hypothetical protein